MEDDKITRKQNKKDNDKQDNPFKRNESRREEKDKPLV